MPTKLNIWQVLLSKRTNRGYLSGVSHVQFHQWPMWTQPHNRSIRFHRILPNRIRNMRPNNWAMLFHNEWHWQQRMLLHDVRGAPWYTHTNFYWQLLQYHCVAIRRMQPQSMGATYQTKYTPHVKPVITWPAAAQSHAAHLVPVAAHPQTKTHLE